MWPHIGQIILDELREPLPIFKISTEYHTICRRSIILHDFIKGLIWPIRTMDPKIQNTTGWTTTLLMWQTFSYFTAKYPEKNLSAWFQEMVHVTYLYMVIWKILHESTYKFLLHVHRTLAALSFLHVLYISACVGASIVLWWANNVQCAVNNPCKKRDFPGIQNRDKPIFLCVCTQETWQTCEKWDSWWVWCHKHPHGHTSTKAVSVDMHTYTILF